LFLGAITCVGSALYAQQLDRKNPTRDKVMLVHKSVGLSMAVLIMPRLALRLVSKIPAHLPGPRIQTLASAAAHYGLLGSLVVLTGSGVAMGYFSGFGVPFFGWKGLSGATAENKNPEIAKQSFRIHQWTGQALEYLVPVHIGGVAFGALQGYKLLNRINPFAKHAAEVVAKTAIK
jgi:cytochrome b561